MTLLAYSSNSREVYKADIYRVLSLPTGYIMHFRYKSKHVDKTILHCNNKGKEVIILFCDALTLNKKITNIAVRKAIVTHTEYSDSTEVFHIYMELKEFCNIDEQIIPNSSKPPTSYLCEVKRDILDTHLTSSSWKGRVDILKSSFLPKIYYHIESIKLSNKLITPKRHITEKNSYYELIYGKEYFIDLKIANPDGSNHTLEILHDENSICASFSNPIRTSLQYDDIEIPTSVRLLQENRQISTLKITPMDENGEIKEYSSIIETKLKKSKMSALCFGLFASLGLTGILLARIQCSVPINIIGIVLFFIAAYLLYLYHNKK